jgi:hypothetical protein
VPLFSPILLLTGLTFVAGEERPLEHMVAYVRECISFANTVRRRTRECLKTGNEKGGRPRG